MPIYGLHIILLAIPAFLNIEIEKILWGLVTISIIRFVWLVILIFKYSDKTLSIKFLAKFYKYSIPLILTSFIAGSAQYICNFFVTTNFDSATFAIFKYGARELPITLLLSSALANAMIPQFSQSNQIDQTLNTFKSKVSNLMNLLFPLTIFLLLTSKFIFPLVFNPNFRGSAEIFNIFLLITISRVIFPNVLLMAQKKTNYILIASISEMIVILLLCIILMQFGGIKGISFSISIAYLIEKIILAWFCYKKLGISPKKYLDIRLWLIYSILTIIAFCFSEF